MEFVGADDPDQRIFTEDEVLVVHATCPTPLPVHDVGNGAPPAADPGHGDGTTHGDWQRPGILTVGELRALLHDDSDDTPVVLATDGWYVNVRSVVRPVDDADWSCVTLFPGDDWDARSL